jgi:hypothetical protein
MVGTLLMAGLTVAIGIWFYLGPSAACEPVFPSPNLTHGLDLAYLKAHNHRTAGSVALESEAVTSRFISHDPRNFAVEVSVGDYATAFGLPATAAQNVFYRQDPYRNDPSRRVILVFSRGEFDWKYTGDTAASVSGVVHIPYRVAMGAIDAQTGNLLFDQTPVCK